MEGHMMFQRMPAKSCDWREGQHKESQGKSSSPRSKCEEESFTCLNQTGESSSSHLNLGFYLLILGSHPPSLKKKPITKVKQFYSEVFWGGQKISSTLDIEVSSFFTFAPLHCCLLGCLMLKNKKKALDWKVFFPSPFFSWGFSFPLEPLFLLGLFFPLELFFLLGIFFLWSKDALLKKTKTSQRQRQAQAKWSEGWCWPRVLIEEKVKTRKAKASQPKIQMWRGILPLSDSDWGEFLFTFELGLLSLVLLHIWPWAFIFWLWEANAPAW